MLLSCGVAEDSWVSLGLQDQTSPALKEINPEYSLEGLMLTLQYFSHLMRRANSLEKTLISAGKEWRQEKGTTENEMAGWHHRLNGHEFEQTLGDGGGQGSLTWCSPWGSEESNTTKQLNNNNYNNPSPVHTQSSRFSQPISMSSFPRITGLDEDLQFLRFTSGLLHVKACNTKHKIKNLNFKRSNLYYFICINVIETRPLEDRN